jgi:hypothetical protein
MTILNRTERSANIWVPGITVSQAAKCVDEFFRLNGYSREGGTPQRASYGKGSAYGRLALGVLAERYKFDVNVGHHESGATIVVAMGMSGVSGGTMGRSKMRSEFERVVEGLAVALPESSAGQSARLAAMMPASPDANLPTQLASLADLNAVGALTDAEFAAAKARLLAGQPQPLKAGQSLIVDSVVAQTSSSPSALYQPNPNAPPVASGFPTIPCGADGAAVSYKRLFQVHCPAEVAFPIIWEYMTSSRWIHTPIPFPGIIESQWADSSHGDEWLTVKIRAMGPARLGETEIELIAWSDKAFEGFGLFLTLARRATTRILTNHLARFETTVLPRLGWSPMRD